MTPDDRKKVKALVAIVAGFFALARCNSPKVALQDGTEFAQLAEDAGLINDLGLEDLVGG
jgi:EAL domain-containing protein (putative c-di-GMP-specific phosphodiesterase class I)